MTEQQSTEEKTAGVAAAEWWAEQVGSPVFRAVSASSPREDHETAGFAGMMQTVLSSRHPVSDDQGAKFVTALAPVIDARLAERSDWGVTLGVDYGPDLELAKAAEVAGIHLSRFPWKTMMWAKRKVVTASLGYHGRTRIVWHAADWVNPPCHQHDYDREGYVLDSNVVCGKLLYHEDDHGDWAPDADRCAVCGGTYPDHYGKGRERLSHLWETAR